MGNFLLACFFPHVSHPAKPETALLPALALGKASSFPPTGVAEPERRTALRKACPVFTHSAATEIKLRLCCISASGRYGAKNSSAMGRVPIALRNSSPSRGCDGFASRNDPHAILLARFSQQGSSIFRHHERSMRRNGNGLARRAGELGCPASEVFFPGKAVRRFSFSAREPAQRDGQQAHRCLGYRRCSQAVIPRPSVHLAGARSN